MATTALVYIRQSVHKGRQAETTVSPQVQEEHERALPAVQACENVEVFSDLNLSGKSVKGRREFQRFLDRLKDADVRAVAFYDISRAFRNLRESLDFRAEMERLRERITVATCIGQNYDDYSPVGNFSAAVLGAAHQMEREMVAVKVKAAKQYQRARGMSTGKVSFGYRKGDGGRVEPDEATAAVVRSIFDLYATGDYSLHSLVRKLHDDGVQAPGRKGWQVATLGYVLRNVAYIGKTYTDDHNTRKGEQIDALWPGIVKPATFERVQRLADDRKWYHRHGSDKHTGNFSVSDKAAFAGLARCAKCGETMRLLPSGNGPEGQGLYIYYGCAKDAVHRCDAPRVHERELLAWADALFGAVGLLGKGGFDAAIKEGTATRKTGRSIAGIDKALDRAKRLFVMGDFSEAEYQREKSRLNALREEAASQVAPSATPPAFKDVYDEWRSADPARRRRILAKLFEAIVVEDRVVVRYVARPEYADELDAVIRRSVGDSLTYFAPDRRGKQPSDPAKARTFKRVFQLDRKRKPAAAAKRQLEIAV